RWRSGLARSRQGMHTGWRYRAMADFDLVPGMSLGWMGERYTEGFMDIRRYAAGSDAAAGGRQRWSASWTPEGWGEWSGSFETVRDRHGPRERRFGLRQRLWLCRTWVGGVYAGMEVVGGDYDIGLRFSFPLY